MKEIQEALVWTTDTPTEPGWYWVKWSGGGTTIRHLNVFEIKREGHTMSHFAGPIPEPQEEPTV
jgi:hypothetical protein